MDENTMRKIAYENSRSNYARAIDIMKDRAWKISQTGKKAERETLAIELTENLDALCENIMHMVDACYHIIDRTEDID